MNKFFLFCLFALLGAAQVNGAKRGYRHISIGQEVATNGEDRSIMYLGDDDKSHNPSSNLSTGTFIKVDKGLTAANKNDLNQDGEVNMADVNILVDHILGKSTYNGDADINGDTQVSVADVAKLVDIILNGNKIVTTIESDVDIHFDGGGSGPARSRQLDGDDKE